MGDEEEEKVERQRFYIELKPGETTIVSWKKLLREANHHCGPHHSSSTTPTPRRTLGKKYDGVQCDDSIVGNKKVKLVNRATSSGSMQPSKCQVGMTKVESQKNDGHLLIKHTGPENLSAMATAKTSNLFDETLRRYSSPAMVTDHRPEDLHAFAVDAPVLTYSKRSTSYVSKSKCPPLNAVEDAPLFPLKSTHNVQQKTQNLSSENMEVGVGCDLSDVMHQNFEGRFVPVKNSPTSGLLLHDTISSKSLHNDKSGGNCKLSDAMVKDHRPEQLQALAVNSPFLTYSKKSASFCSKSKCSSLIATEDASVSPLKTVRTAQKNTQNIPSEKMKVAVGGNSSDIMHQNLEGRCVPVKNSPTSGLLLDDKLSSNRWYSDKSGGSFELVDAISSGYKSSTKDSDYGLKRSWITIR